jgi:hypothetical protein
LNAFGEPLHALFVAGVGRGYAKRWFRHSGPVYLAGPDSCDLRSRVARNSTRSPLRTEVERSAFLPMRILLSSDRIMNASLSRPTNLPA